ncbi:type III secretion protein [Mesorhizobium neociceri]|uniref:Type III secretion protein n=1 Tax=Mesorhizobium neociceri TaxID=1307853 RepID=A0A838BEE3_9HYPH|nr:type III secretion protein [Mesorhizobium neociceri]
MILLPVQRLLELKELRRRRTEDALRRRHGALDNAVAAVQTAVTDLRRWREHRPSREAALYDPLIGKAAALIDLEEVKAKVISLYQHEQLLQNRLEGARAEADRARQAREEAYHVAREAWRAVSKFEDLVRVLRTDANVEGERSTDLELEDFAQGRNSLGSEQNDDPITCLPTCCSKSVMR